MAPFYGWGSTKNYALAWVEPIKHLRWNVFAKIVNSFLLYSILNV